MSAAEDFLDEPEVKTGTAECVAFVDDNQTHGVVANVTSQFFGDPQVRAGNCKDALHYFSEAEPPRILIVDIGDGEDPLATMLSLVTAFPPETRLIGVGSVNDISLYRELTEAGIVDYLVKPISEKNLTAALTRAEENTELGRSGDTGDSQDRRHWRTRRRRCQRGRSEPRLAAGGREEAEDGSYRPGPLVRHRRSITRHRADTGLARGPREPVTH